MRRTTAPAHNSLLLLLLALASACALLAHAADTTPVDALEHTQRAAMMMDMPPDPVSGEMVMSTAYHFDLQNGQRLRFATRDTLAQFLQDPKTGLKSVESVDAHTADASTASATSSSGKLCPVCGMETSATGGPQVTTQHGDQVIKTCSMTHARQVLDHALLYQAEAKSGRDGGNGAPATAPATAAHDAAAGDFCSGPGTTMLNGFTFSRSNGGTPCVLLWFPGWVLSTRWLYALGCVGVALVAVFNEYLMHVRRLLRKESSTLKRLRSVPNSSVNINSARLSTSEATQLLRSSSYPSQSSSLTQACCPAWFRTLSPETQHLVHCLLHGFTISIAYMLMLVSMTYDWLLFLSTITGYIVGHYVFGERRDSISEPSQMTFP